MSDGIIARKIAHEVLTEVLNKKLPLDQVIDKHAGFNSLDSRDRGLVFLLIATVLRRRGQCDSLIKTLQNKIDQKLNDSIQNVLRIGLTQLLFLDIPHHAAVDTTVALCDALDLSGFKTFVNAVLRRTIREREILTKNLRNVRLNLPEWLFARLSADWGEEAALEIGRASLNEAPLDLTIKEAQKVQLYIFQLEGNHLFGNTLRLDERVPVSQTKGFSEGDWWVQDASAALPAALLGDVSGKIIYDICAAPGGKTAQLASAGAKVTALDRSGNRQKRLAENMSRLKLTQNVDIIIDDATTWVPPEPADIVLLDAPCSSTGIIRRHPDILYLKSEDDIANLVDVQKRLLDNAAKMVKPGGILMYCTCSIFKIEGEEQVASFLENHPEFQSVDFDPREVGGHSEFINEHGQIRLFPTHMAEKGGMDGFFIARLKKTA